MLFIPLWLNAQSDGLPRGAYQMPYTRYEAEDASFSGTLYQANAFDQSQTASEASNQKYVGLPSNGSAVTFTTTTSGQGVTMRFTMPDAAGGDGINGTLAVYVNGNLDQVVDVSSYWAYQYLATGSIHPSNSPGAGNKVRMRFDEVHFKLNQNVTAGSTITIAKNASDGTEYGIDFIEVEPVPAAIQKPAGFLDIRDYGAVANDTGDDLPALESCMAAAAASGTGVYIPEGTWYLDFRWIVPQSNVTVTGAGMWHTNLYFSNNDQFGGGIYGDGATNVTMGNFYINTVNNDRMDYHEGYSEAPGTPYKIYKAFMGTFAQSNIHDVWQEHFEVGIWMGDYDHMPRNIAMNTTFSRMRIRNNYADGCNFANGSSFCVLEHSNVRNGGDDGMAVWPDGSGTTVFAEGNIFRYNTVEHIYRAGGAALFGGSNHEIHHCIIKDGFAGSGIRLTTDFSTPESPKFKASGLMKIYENTIIGCGTSYDLWDRKRGSIEINVPQGLNNVLFENIDILNSQRHAIQIEGNGFNDVNFNNITVDGTGKDATVRNIAGDVYGGLAMMVQANSGTLTVNKIAMSDIESVNEDGNKDILNRNAGFNLNVIDTQIDLTGITLSPAPVDMVVGETEQIAIGFNPTNATNKGVTWSNSNPAVATFDAQSLQVTGVGTGTTTITATSVENPSITASTTVTVSAAVNIIATDNQASESGDTGEFTIAISSTSQNITVNYSVGGTASASDYAANPALTGSVTLTPTNLSQTITINPTDDTSFEGQETLQLTLLPGTGYQLGGNTSATISISDNENPPCTAPVIGYIATAPSIDQNIDAVWSTAPAKGISNATIGGTPGDYTGQWKALYDANNLYVLVEVSDATRTNDSGSEWWNDDVVEIFIDGNNSKGTTYDGLNDFQLGFRWNDATVHAGGNSVQNTSGINFSMYAAGSGYVLEAAIPWSTIGTTPVIGTQIGFDVAVDDDDNGGDRDAQMVSIATTDAGWSNPSIFGSIYLTDCSGAPSNQVPSVNAGSDQTVVAGTTSVNLNGSATDPDGDALTYTWSQVSGPAASISNAASAGTSVTGLADGNTYVFRLTVNDGEITASDDVQVIVNSPAANQAPTAEAGSNQILAAGSTSANLSGSGADPENGTLTYAWTQVSGNAVTISSTNSAATAVSGLTDGNSYTFRLTVSDGELSATDDVTLTVNNPGSTGGGGDGTSRGAYMMPYTRYESDASSLGGGAVLMGPSFDQTKVESEATDQVCAKLSAVNSFVKWTTTAAGQGLVMRFSMPDAAGGGGQSGKLALYVDGNFVQDIDVSSKWAWQYFSPNPGDGTKHPSNTPIAGYTSRMKFDEVRVKLASQIPVGAEVKIQKTSASGNIDYVVDFVELEPIEPVIPQPTNSLSVLDYGADGTDLNSDQEAFQNCIQAAITQGKSVYVPAGHFRIGRLWVDGSNLTFQGAGIWHTDLYCYNASSNNGGFETRGSNLHFQDFHLGSENTTRTDAYKAFVGLYTNSTIERVWVEHFEVGAWIANYQSTDVTDGLVISNCRFRNNYADGVNFAKGTRNSICEHSDMRNNGDDAMATWSADGPSASVNNEFRYCTAENTWRAAGIGFFGGGGHKGHHLIIKDNVETGIRVNSDFPVNHQFSTTEWMEIYETTVIGCGTNANLWFNRYGAVDIFTRLYNVQNLRLRNVDILNSQKDAIMIYDVASNYTITNVELINVTIDGAGMDGNANNYTSGDYDDYQGHGLLVLPEVDGFMTTQNLNIYNTPTASIQNESDPNFLINTLGNQAVTGVSLSPQNFSLAEGQTQQLSTNIQPANATNQNVTYATSNANVATVNAAGLVTAVAPGTATITVTTEDGGFTATTSVTVNAAVNITATDASAAEGGNTGTFVISTSSIAQNITVNYSVGGTASSSDYSSSPSLSGSVTLTPSNPSQTITITPSDDAEFEGAETLQITLLSGSGYQLGGSTSATVTIADNDFPPCTAPIIGYASTTPAIDQSIESVWGSAPSKNISNTTIGGTPGDYSGQWRALYDNNNLYVLVEVGDATRTNDSGANWWNDDVVEIFIDGDNSKGTSYDGLNDFQLAFRWNDASVNVGGNSVQNTTGISFSMYASGSGYVLEAAIPWSTIGTTPNIGTAIGFDVAVDDDDNGGDRDAQVVSIATSDAGWSNPSLFGSIYLTDCSGVPSNQAPSANAGNDQSLASGSTSASLSGSGADADNDPITFAWTQVSGASVTINNASSANATVSGLADGNTYVFRLTVSDGSLSSSDDVTVTVGSPSSVPVSGVSVSPTSVSLSEGNTQQLSATVAPSNASNQAVSWSSNNTSVATVSGSGLVTAVAAGSATITVTTADGGYTASSTVTVTSSGGGSASAYRIRNVWQNTYLADGGDRVTYNTTASGSNFEWELEDVGGGYVEIKNVGTGEYMHIENLTGYVQATTRTFGWYSSRWAVEDAGNGESRIRNAWQSNNYIHVENLQGHAQHGTIYDAWGSAKWVLEPVGGSSSRVAGFTREQLDVSEKLNVYPNPMNADYFTISFNGQVDAQSVVQFYDLTGALIRTEKLTGQKTTLNRGKMPSGIYLLRIQAQGERFTKKLLIK
ncbi:sugar-binding protein [Limibacter armeniacum]|uniref:sugar-binding protein n=1 Tax=Limibacter armeniacum TaxID=466084 RepID=UPI002FE5E972